MDSTIYLDNAATTRAHPEVVETMVQALGDGFGNPSARHGRGIQARRRLEDARETIAHYAGIAPEGVVFTSGGTEANNLAARGFPMRSGTQRILTSAAEHPSLRRPLQARTDGVVELVNLTPHGTMDLDDLEGRLDEDVGLVATFEGQNEIGCRQPVNEISKRVRLQAPRAFLHLDSVQAFGKPGAPPFDPGISSASISGHKIHGPQGTGALLLNTRSTPASLLLGGGQESDQRSGTENLPGILGLAKAVELLAQRTRSDDEAWQRRRERFEEQLRQSISGLHILAHDAPRLPHIVAVVIPGTLAEVVLHHLEQEGVLASAGAACQASKSQLSPALVAMGMPPENIRGTLRLSLSRQTTDEELDHVVACLPGIVDKLRSLGAIR